jgi:PAS domain-containing protein
MADPKLLAAILDSMKNPVLFADTQHTTRYMNRAAIEHYDEGAALIGRSLFECHNEESNRIIREVFAAMQQGETERLITDNEKYRIFMRAVRDGDGTLLGYYERYEPPRVNGASTSASD